MERLSYEGKIFSLYEYSKESDFEGDVIEYSKEIFGPKSSYIDIKKKIENDNIITIPDGYLLVFHSKVIPGYILWKMN